MKKALIIVSFFLAFSACNKANVEDKQHCDGVTATLKDYTGLDGCSWVLVLKNDDVLEPINIDEFDLALKEDLKVVVDYEIAADALSICMVGDMVKINCIEKK